MSQTLDANLNVISEDETIEIELMNGDLNIIQKLDDEPNDVGGLTAQELKAKFDESGNTIKKYINETLVPAVLAADATEAARTAAENERAANEQERVSNETARVEAEGKRETAETNRSSAETERASAEAVRAQTEQERAAAEAARVTAEKDRAAAETERANDESTRRASESARVTAEQQRVANETARGNAETVRTQNETARVQAETTRKTEFGTMQAQNEIALNEVKGAAALLEAMRVFAETLNPGSNATVKLVANTSTGGYDVTFGIPKGEAGDGTGDMQTAVYDPQNKNTDVFKYVDDAVSNIDPVSLTAPVPVEKGGTNAASVEDARANLDVYSKEETEQKIAADTAKCVTATTEIPDADDMTEGEIRLAYLDAPRLPEGYTEVEYIESNGEQYINTEWTPTSDSVKVVAKAQILTQTTSEQYIFGATSWASPRRYSPVISIINGNANARCGAAVIYNVATVGTDRASVFEAELKDGVAKVSVDAKQQEIAFTGALAAVPLYLFAENYESTTARFASTARMEYARGYENGVLVYDYVPCIDSNGVAGMYDLITGVFKGSEGAEAFIAGPAVNFEVQEPSVGVFLKKDGKVEGAIIKNNSATTAEIDKAIANAIGDINTILDEINGEAV